MSVLLGAGREADVYAHDDDAVLKLYRPGFGGHRTEAAALTALAGTGVAPKLVGVVDRDGRPGLVVERIAGPDMLAAVQRQPWRVHAFARTLADAHLAVHNVHAPSELAELRTMLAGRIGDAGLPPDLYAFAMRVLDGLPDGDQLCHGDYHPGNVLLAAGRTAVIDWGSAARGVPEADHARTLLLLRWADPLPGTPVLQRAVIGGGRALLASAYTRAYRRGQPLGRHSLRETKLWLAVHVAARLGEGIDAERETMLGRLRGFMG
jgi:aminoglycoside phosphotransferase (APT) family kinase protein